MPFFFLTLVLDPQSWPRRTNLFNLNFHGTQINDKHSQFPHKCKKKRKSSGAEDSGHCSSDARLRRLTAVLATGPRSRRHRWTRSRPALRVPSVVLSSAARYSLPQAPGSSFPPHLLRRATPRRVRGVAVSSCARSLSHPTTRGDWSRASGRPGFRLGLPSASLGRQPVPSAAGVAALGWGAPAAEQGQGAQPDLPALYSPPSGQRRQPGKERGWWRDCPRPVSDPAGLELGVRTGDLTSGILPSLGSPGTFPRRLILQHFR